MMKLATPIIIGCMGAEMVYILQQRLAAQGLTLDKSKSVIDDVIRSMFDSVLVEEIFQCQDTYSTKSTKLVFCRIANCSVLRLSSER